MTTVSETVLLCLLKHLRKRACRYSERPRWFLVLVKALDKTCLLLQRDADLAHTVSDGLVVSVQIYFQMDLDEVLESHLDDNCASNGPHVALKPLDKTRQN